MYVLRRTSALCMVAAGVFFCCCGQKKAPLPIRVMAPLMVDIHLAEAVVEYNYTNRPQALHMQRQLEDSIFVRYNTTDSLYLQSLHHYVTHPKKFNLLYQAIIDDLRARRRNTP